MKSVTLDTEDEVAPLRRCPARAAAEGDARHGQRSPDHLQEAARWTASRDEFTKKRCATISTIQCINCRVKIVCIVIVIHSEKLVIVAFCFIMFALRSAAHILSLFFQDVDVLAFLNYSR